MNSQLLWDDLRFLLAIAEAGSLSGAGRRLGVSHATVYRRLGEIEARLGSRLFERGREGYAATPAGEALAAAARRVEAEVLEVERRLAGQDPRPAGRLRVTTTDSLLFGLLSPLFAKFRQAYPDVALEVVVSNQLFNLSRREAEVALRPGNTPPETLVGRRIGVIAQAVYGHRELKAQRGKEPWIGPDEAMHHRPLEVWMAEQGHAERCGYTIDSVLGMVAAARDGAGLAVLPCYLGDAEPALRRHGKVLPDLATDLWLLTHQDLRATGRVRAFLDFIAGEARRLQPCLAGRADRKKSS